MLRVKCKEVFPGVWFNFEVLYHLFSKKWVFQSLREFLHFFSEFVYVGMKPVLLIKACKPLKVNFWQSFLKVDQVWFKIDDLVSEWIQMTLKILLIDLKVKIHYVCVKYENWCEISIFKTPCIVVDLIDDVVRRKRLMYKIKDFLLCQFILYNFVKN